MEENQETQEILGNNDNQMEIQENQENKDLKEKEEEIDSDTVKLLDNNPPSLLNPLFYDDRAKKRNEQQKKRRQRLHLGETTETPENSTEPVNPAAPNQENSEVEESVTLKNKKLTLPSKNFIEKTETENSDSLEKTIKANLNPPELSNDTKYIIEALDECEVIVSDIDEIQDDGAEIKEIKNYATKKPQTFVEITNQLSEKKKIMGNENNLTNSYLYALNFSAPAQNAQNDITSSSENIKKRNLNFEGDYDSRNNNIQNYILNSIMEEENSEYESETGSKRRSLLKSSISPDKILLRQGSFKSNFFNESPRDLFSPMKKIEFNLFSVNRHSLGEIDLGKIQRDRVNQICHKVSKSDVVDARIEVISRMEALERKINSRRRTINHNKSRIKRIVLKEILLTRCKLNFYYHLHL